MYSDMINEYTDLIRQEAELIKSIVRPDNIKIVNKGERYTIKKDEIVIVLEGFFTIDLMQTGFPAEATGDKETETPCRVGQGIKGMILGLVETYGPAITLHYVARQKVKIATFSRDYFEDYFIQRDKFNYLMKVSAYMLAIVLESYSERNFGNRYHVIRSMIYRYQKQREEGILPDSSLAGFILQRTKMSRSYLFKILSDLKSGGYIDVQQGKLTAILKDLPEKY